MSQKILVVEDDAQVRGLIRATLERAGYGVREAANGVEAQAVVGSATFDLVITDILMPERDGLETIMFLRRGRPATKIIAVSGSLNELFLQDARGLGATAILTKPFTPAMLLDSVTQTLRPEGAACRTPGQA